MKKFMEEVRPLALFADAFYKDRKEILFQMILSYQSYDALILESPSYKFAYRLQITQSIDGYQNHLRMLHLEEHGRAPLTGSKLQKGRTSGRVPETSPEAVEHTELLDQTFEQVHHAVQRKSQMRYEAGTSLIVEFEDNHIHPKSDRLAFDRFARSSLVPAAASFAALYLVSDRKRLAFSYKTKAAS